jgi:deoxyribose-phosphate aldolase
VTESELEALADAIVAKVHGSRTAAQPHSRTDRTHGRTDARTHGALALKLEPTARPVPSGRRAVLPSGGARRIADFVDHTLLKAEATRAEVVKLCAEAKQHRFAAVCVNGNWVATCAKELQGTDVGLASVVGFPLGAMTSRAKAAEAREAVASGANEIDMVIALGRLKSGEWAYVEDDIRAVVEASMPGIVKVIIESSTLTPDEIIKASALAKEAGAHFVKTSTGFHASGGASVEAVRLMKLVVGDVLGVKASGGVRDCQTALTMVAAGANRIGTSSGVGMVTCLGPGPLPLAELLKAPQNRASVCTCGTCACGGGGTQPY